MLRSMKDSREDAILYSVGANASHGMRRTNEDKRRAVRTALRVKPEENDLAIARRCFVSSMFVGNVRREELSLNGLMIPPAREINRGGTTYAMVTGNIGRAEGGKEEFEPASSDPASRDDDPRAPVEDAADVVDSPALEPEPADPAPKPEAPKAKDHAWTDGELERRRRVEAGETVVANYQCDHALIAWATAEGLFVRADRKSEWGNPFEMDKDGARGTVIRNYGRYYLPHKPSLLGKIGDLAGKVLGCWCHPEPCHCDVLIKELEKGS